jgi:hypothetical protein
MKLLNTLSYRPENRLRIISQDTHKRFGPALLVYEDNLEIAAEGVSLIHLLSSDDGAAAKLATPTAGTSLITVTV